MSAGDAWKKFGKELRPQLENDESLQRLAREVLEGRGERLPVLTSLLHARISAFVQNLPAEARTFWYDDPLLATRYSGAQQAVVPVRTDIANQLADVAWVTIERTLQKRPIAHILDLGTGDGVMARTLLARRPEHLSRERLIVVASDRSAAMLTTHSAIFAEHDILTMEAAHGDMRGKTWHELDTYRTLLGQGFSGFDVVLGMMCFHILPNRGAELYPGIAQILRTEGVLAFTHDFFAPNETWSTFAPTNTLVEGYRAYACVTECPISFVGYLAGFLLRRSVLQDDQLCTLSEEVTAVECTFPYVRTDKHVRYEEFAVITASHSELPDTASNSAFKRSLQ